MPEGQEPAATEDVPTGQEPTGTDEPKAFDEAYVKKLREEAAGHRTRANDFEARLKEIEDRDKTEAQKLAEERDNLTKTTSDLRAQLDRYEVAKDTGLDLDLVELLNGSKEQMAAQAAVLLERTKPKVDPSTFDGGARQTAEGGDMNNLLRAAAGRN